MYYHNTKTTNEPTASNNKSDRPQVNIWDTWKTLKYLNINDSFHLKDLEISKYKWESKARMSIKFCCLIFVNCGLFSFLNIKKVKILNENTVADGNVLCKRMHSNLWILKNNQLDPYVSRWLFVSLIIFKNLQLGVYSPLCILIRNILITAYFDTKWSIWVHFSFSRMRNSYPRQMTK
jgi:hypothetical protein